VPDTDLLGGFHAAAEVGVALPGGAQGEVAVAVERHIPAIVAKQAEDRWVDRFVPAHHRPLRQIRRCTCGSVEVVDEDVVDGPGVGVGRRSARILGLTWG
jgi:uncharacterized Ntn-hydrolase superfamily protein